MAELTREELTRRGLEAFKNSKPWGSQSVDIIKTAENKTADTTDTAFENQAQAKPWINTEQDKRLDEVSKGTEHAVPYWGKNY